MSHREDVNYASSTLFTSKQHRARLVSRIIFVHCTFPRVYHPRRGSPRCRHYLSAHVCHPPLSPRLESQVPSGKLARKLACPRRTCNPACLEIPRLSAQDIVRAQRRPGVTYNRAVNEPSYRGWSLAIPPLDS